MHVNVRMSYVRQLPNPDGINVVLKKSRGLLCSMTFCSRVSCLQRCAVFSYFHINLVFEQKKRKTKFNFENEILKYLIMVTQKIL